MSAATDSVVGVEFLALPLIVPVGVAALAAYGIGYGAYAAAIQLQREYEAALGEFQARASVEQGRRAEASRRQQAAAASASALAANTYLDPLGDATLQFLQESTRRLVERAAGLGDAALIAQCQALLQEVGRESGDTSALLTRYFSLSDAVAAADAARLVHRPNVGDALKAVLEAARQEIQSPLLLRPECASVRAQLTAQLEKLQRLPSTEAALVIQGLELLLQRVHRELRLQAEREQERSRNAAAVRDLVSDMLAKLRAVSRQTFLLEHSAQAESLLRELNSHLARAERTDPASLQPLKERVDRLFGGCERVLQQRAVAEYVGAQVTDVLLSLGYQVSHLPSESHSGSTACVATVDSSVGVQFQVDPDGRLRTEMVALTESASDVADAMQERVCILVDQVLQSLRQRPECTVREKVRRRAKAGQRLRVLQLPGHATQSTPAVAAPQRISREL